MTFLAFAGNVQLIPDGSLLIHIGMILLMIWILNRTFFGPIQKAIEAREGKKGGAKGPAGEILEQVADKRASYESEIREMRLAGYQIIETNREVALSRKQTSIQIVKHEVAEKLAKEIAVIERETNVAKEEIQKEADKIAEKIAASILK
jgi:F0F1-type ATP synthase membrane subunit b/b'